MKVQSIADREAHAGSITACDHLIAIGHGAGHRFLTNDVFSRRGRNEHIALMQSRWSHHVNDVDLSVIRDAVHRLVTVNTLLGKPMVSRVTAAFALRVTGYDSTQLTEFGFKQSRGELTSGVGPHADERHAKLTAPG